MIRKTDLVTPPFTEEELQEKIQELCSSVAASLCSKSIKILGQMTADERAKFASDLAGDQQPWLLAKMIVIAAAESPLVDQELGAEAYKKRPAQIRRAVRNRY